MRLTSDKRTGLMVDAVGATIKRDASRPACDLLPKGEEIKLISSRISPARHQEDLHGTHRVANQPRFGGIPGQSRSDRGAGPKTAGRKGTHSTGRSGAGAQTSR